MRNGDVRKELKVAELREKIRECRERWYCHVMRMEENKFVGSAAESREPGSVVDLDKAYRIWTID